MKIKQLLFSEIDVKMRGGYVKFVAEVGVLGLKYTIEGVPDTKLQAYLSAKNEFIIEDIAIGDSIDIAEVKDLCQKHREQFILSQFEQEEMRDTFNYTDLVERYRGEE